MIDNQLLLNKENEIETKIIDAFMTLYATKPIEKISIKSITDLAGLNRGTFYLHYLDIYDLLKKIEENFHSMIKIIAHSSLTALFNNGNLSDSLPTTDFYKKRHKYLKLLLCTKGKSSLDEVMKTEIKRIISQQYLVDTRKKHPLYDYALEFITSAQVSTIMLWIKNDMLIPQENLSFFIQTWSTNGVLDFLKN